jgi:hypothetical protein
MTNESLLDKDWIATVARFGGAEHLEKEAREAGPRRQVLRRYLAADSVEENQRVNCFQRPVLPFGDFVQHGIGHRTDEIGRGVDAVEFAQMTLPKRVHARVAQISRTLIPRAYMETIFSSKPGKRR